MASKRKSYSQVMTPRSSAVTQDYSTLTDAATFCLYVRKTGKGGLGFAIPRAKNKRPRYPVVMITKR